VTKGARVSRRDFLKGAAASAVGLSMGDILASGKAPYLKNKRVGSKTIVLGIDGMDPKLLRQFVDQGYMPTFKAFMERSRFGELGTTMPPQSPVAWSSFITGTNPGGHGIFDFVHRDPNALLPYLSTTRSYSSDSKLSIGEWCLPLGSGRVDLMRKGRPFWSLLEERGIPSTIFALPANFPVVEEGSVQALSGMGTPDLLGTYGTFTLFSEVDVPDSNDWSGGRVVRVRPVNNVYSAVLEGPTNSFRNDGTAASVPVVISRDPWDPIVKIDIGGETLVLKQGEWSEWVPLSFEFIPLFATVGGMVRLFVKQVHPTLKVYVSPINIDPMEPTLPIGSPSGYSREIAQAVGRFYTQGFPADQKAVALGAISDDEYFHQANIVIDENLKILDYQLSRYDDGFFFYYFSCIDQNCHMLWRLCDPSHPLYRPNASPELKTSVRRLYQRMDDALKLVLSKVDDSTTFFVISDHGFGTFEREFHISRWLVEQGYTVLKDPESHEPGDMYDRVDWSKTRAYALGINGVYVNLKDREPNGIVDPQEAQRIKDEIIARLVLAVDPLRNKPIVRAAYDSHKIYSGPHLFLAPDVLVGYHSGYRVSDEAVLGKFPREMVGDRTNKWSADHCFDPGLVPGIILSNKTDWGRGTPAIWDMAPSILKSFGLEIPAEMDGKPIQV
jgi:predicted AlkP superfamily phosphohydrolase/phosphomutase